MLKSPLVVRYTLTSQLGTVNNGRIRVVGFTVTMQTNSLHSNSRAKQKFLSQFSKEAGQPACETRRFNITPNRQ
jgi:hypothetical protein